MLSSLGTGHRTFGGEEGRIILSDQQVWGEGRDLIFTNLMDVLVIEVVK